MKHTLKRISTSGIDEAIAKAQLYRYLNEPEESESICHDILAVDTENQMALRTLGLAITDQFSGSASERFGEAESYFLRLSDTYERHYYLGLLHERRAKARLGHPQHILADMFENAMHYFEEAERLRPCGNDDAILRWNRCARLLETLPNRGEERELAFEMHDSAPENKMRRSS